MSEIISAYEPPIHIAEARAAFEAKLRRHPVSACLLYTGTTPHRFYFRGLTFYPHRFAWRLWRGELNTTRDFATNRHPDQVFHCPLDKTCVEPSHLSLEKPCRYTAAQLEQMAINRKSHEDARLYEQRRLQREFDERRSNGELLA